MKKPNTQQANYRMPKPLLKELKRVSKLSGILSQSDIVRKAVQEKVDQLKTQISQQDHKPRKLKELIN